MTTGEEPPASRHPSLNDGTAVESHTLLERFAQIPGVPVPTETTRAIRLDYGPESHLGRTIKLPADEGEEFPALVADIDESFNERRGICLPDLTVPVATYTGWNLRDESIGNPGLFIGITGGLAGWTLPLPATRAEREASGDPRSSIEERYADRQDYLEKVNRAAMDLVDEGYLLEEDVDEVVDLAGRKYDYWAGDGRQVLRFPCDRFSKRSGAEPVAGLIAENIVRENRKEEDDHAVAVGSHHRSRLRQGEIRGIHRPHVRPEI